MNTNYPVMRTSLRTKLLEKVNKLPQNPGVYIYKNNVGTVIYVGKAKSLRDRVGSYFALSLPQGTKTYALVQRIVDLEYIIVQSEFEALILEAELIKKYRPKYNILQKDDKSYLYIIIRNETFEVNGSKIKVPKLITARRTDLLPSDIKYGPYPDGSTAKSILRTVRKIFPFRDCSDTKFNTYKNKGKPCLYGFIGVCSGPCVHNSPEELAEYKKYISSIRKMLSGNSTGIVRKLESQMKKASKSQDYEDATHYRDLLQNFKYIMQQFKSPEAYINNPFLVSDLANESLDELIKLVPGLTIKPIRIECYDISNISGTDAVGSMVVATNGIIDKSQYRKFRIKFKSTPDDFEMMREVLTRRLRRKEWPFPDLLVVDGGKGQVSTAYEVAKTLNENILIIGLAKKEETIVYFDGHDFQELKYDKTNAGLKLLIRLRDESHRFAQSYHHKLRAKSILNV